MKINVGPSWYTTALGRPMVLNVHHGRVVDLVVRHSFADGLWRRWAHPPVGRRVISDFGQAGQARHSPLRIRLPVRNGLVAMGPAVLPSDQKIGFLAWLASD